LPFSSLKLDAALLRAVKELGFARPTPIQADAIPHALAGKDLLACASTGSGKTAAFLLPILHHLLAKPRRTTRALVLTPTRELAAQILEDLNDLAVHTPLTREMLHHPVTINMERQAAPAVGITQAVYPVPQELKGHLFLELLKRGEMQEALVFTRTKHRTDRLQKFLVKHGIKAERIHGNRSQGQRTEALAGFKSGKYRVLVATDIVARGIDISELGHVVNFDVPAAPEDYIHRVGRTARAEATGDAFTFVSPEEEGDLRGIERAIGRRLPRITVPDFDYRAKAEVQLEMPHAERIAQIRARKAEERQRAKANAERRAAALAVRTAAETRKAGGGASHRPRPGGGGGSARPQPRRPHRGGRRPEG
jgi:ATP-dependent RNA helicase RhlE